MRRLLPKRVAKGSAKTKAAGLVSDVDILSLLISDRLTG